MTTFTEKTLTSLLDGSLDVDGDTILVYRVNGTVPGSFPHSVDLPQGSAQISQDGSVIFDDGINDPNGAGIPVPLPNGSFTFTIWDGEDESGVYTASVALEGVGDPITAPLKPTDVSASAILSDAFDVILPVDPDDGGDPIIRRVLSVMPQSDYDAGNYANAVYLNDFAAQETRTINLSNYPSIGASQSHVLRWKAINGSTDNNGNGPYSDPVVVTLVATANAPTFTTQPSLSAGSFTVGDTVTLSLGAGTGDNSVTATIEYFRLGSISKTGALSGLDWDSSGSQPGTLYLRTRLTDDVTGASTLSNEVSAPLAAVVGSGGVKGQVLGLFNTSGRNSGSSLQTLTSGNAPSGVSVATNTVTISGNGVTLQDYLIHDKTVFINGDNVTIRQCSITEGPWQNAAANRRIIDIKTNVKNFLIEDNDFAGVKGLGAGVSSALFQRPLSSTASGTGGIIRRNRFKWFGQDCVKTTGGVLIEENVFYAESNIAVVPSGRWNSGTTYGLNEVVKHTSSEKHYVSLSANNQGNALSNSSKWAFFDPHYDFITTYENTIASTIRRNLFLLDNQDSLIPPSDRSLAVGAVNAFRILRNGGNTTPFRALLIEENVTKGYNTYFAGIPIQVANTGGTWIKPTIRGNYMDENGRGEYAHASTAAAVSWGVNYDFTTNATISP